MKRSLLVYICLLATILLTSSPAQAQSTKRVSFCVHLSMEIPSTWHIGDRSLHLELIRKKETDRVQTTPPSIVLNRLFDYTMTAKSAQISIPNAPEPLFVLCEYPMDAIITQHPEKLITAFLHRLPEGQMIVRPTKIKLGGQDAEHIAFRYRKKEGGDPSGRWYRLDLWTQLLANRTALIAMRAPLDLQIDAEREAMIASAHSVVVFPSNPTPVETAK